MHIGGWRNMPERFVVIEIVPGEPSRSHQGQLPHRRTSVVTKTQTQTDTATHPDESSLMRNMPRARSSVGAQMPGPLVLCTW